MKPTVYIQLADLRLTGPCRESASSAARFSAGRSEMHGPWIQAEGKQVGTNDSRSQHAGGSGETRTR